MDTGYTCTRGHLLPNRSRLLLRLRSLPRTSLLRIILDPDDRDDLRDDNGDDGDDCYDDGDDQADRVSDRDSPDAGFC